MDDVSRHRINRWMAHRYARGEISADALVAHVHADAHRHGDLHRHLLPTPPGPEEPERYGQYIARHGHAPTALEHRMVAESNARTVAGVQPHPLLTAGPPQNIAEHIHIKLKKNAAKKKAPAAKDQAKYLRELAVKLTGAAEKRSRPGRTPTQQRAGSRTSSRGATGSKAGRQAERRGASHKPGPRRQPHALAVVAVSDGLGSLELRWRRTAASPNRCSPAPAGRRRTALTRST